MDDDANHLNPDPGATPSGRRTGGPGNPDPGATPSGRRTGGPGNGRVDWIAEAVERYEAPLSRYAARLVRDTDRARDVVQDTFLRLCRQDRRAIDGDLGPWLYTVCRNRAVDVLRKDRREEPLDQVDAATGPPASGPPA